MTYSAGSKQRSRRRTPTQRSKSSTTRTHRPVTSGAAGQRRSSRPSGRTTSSSRKPRPATARTTTNQRRRSARSTTRPRGPKELRQRATAASKSVRSISGKLHPLILPQNIPGWLRSLLQVQQGVWVGTIMLTTFAVGTYGWSVYSQQQWGKSYGQLQRLQRSERQLISGNELMKNEIAQQVDPDALGLAPQKSNNVIFIKPNRSTPEEKTPEAAPSKASSNQPLGY